MPPHNLVAVVHVEWNLEFSAGGETRKGHAMNTTVMTKDGGRWSIAALMGDETVAPAPGAPNEGKVLRRRYTNAWMRQDGTWRLAFKHANNVSETSGK